MKIIDYQVVSSDVNNTWYVSDKVKLLIDKGYVPYGPLIGAHTYIAQAMVKYEEPTRSVAVEIKSPHPAA